MLVSSTEHCDKFKKPQMSYDRFREIINALRPTHEKNDTRSSNWNDYSHMAPEFKVAVEQLSQLAQPLGFSKNNTNISSDDDKCHLRGNSVIKDVGLSKTFQRGSKSGPVAIMAVSLTTGIVLATHFINVGESANVAFKKVLASKYFLNTHLIYRKKVLIFKIYNIRLVAAIGLASNVDNAHFHGLPINVDRQFNNNELLEYITSHSGNLSGTVSHPKQAFQPVSQDEVIR